MWTHPKLAERYKIIEELGQGTTSRVLRVRSKNVPRDFAVKVFVFGAHSSNTARERARREADALSKLQHPHVVTLFEVLELDANHLVLVMDYIDGVRLDRYVKRHGPMPVPRALSVAKQLATALYEGHRRKLVHRDMKPSNVIVRGLASGDLFAHLFDFGIVRGPAPSSLTQGFIGTPEFASPEQSTGGDVDARTDIFGLGATLFFMLTGKAPFPDADMWEAMLEREIVDAPRASEFADVPDYIDDFLAEMMATNPEDRPEHMKRVVARLRGLEKEFDEASLRESTNVEAPPVLLLPVEPSEITEASFGWEAERVTEVVVGPHVLATRGSAVGFIDQDLNVHAVDPSRPMRKMIATGLSEPPKGLVIWDKGAMVLRSDGSVVSYTWDGETREVREADGDVTAIGGFPDGRAVIGLKTGVCLVEQPNGTWKGNRVGRSAVERLAATRESVAMSSPDGAMLVSALSFDVPLMHLGKPIDSMGFSDDAYLLGVARGNKFMVLNVANRRELSSGLLPPQTRQIAFESTNLCAYVIESGKLLRFRFGG